MSDPSRGLTLAQCYDLIKETTETHIRDHHGLKVLNRVGSNMCRYAAEVRHVLSYLDLVSKHPTRTAIANLDRLAAMSEGVGAALDTTDAAHVTELGAHLTSIAGSYQAMVSLVDETEPNSLLEFVRECDDAGVTLVANICKTMKIDAEQNLERLNKELQTIVDTTKDDIRSAIVAKEYARNKRLNKFEKDTNDEINDRVAEHVESSWNALPNECSKVKKQIEHYNHCLTNWTKKLQMVDSVDQARGRSTNHTEHICDLIYPTKIKASSACLDDRKSSSVSKTDSEGRIGRDLTLETTMPNLDKGKHTDHACHEMGLASSSRSADTQSANQKPTNGDSPKVQRYLTGMSDSTFDDSLDKPLGSHSDSFVGQSPIEDEDFVLVTKVVCSAASANANGPHQDNPPTRPADKHAYGRAFAGLDRYARDLFAKSPSPNTAGKK